MNEFKQYQNDYTPWCKKNTEFYVPNVEYKYYGPPEMSEEEFLDRYRICFLREIYWGENE